MKFYFYNAQVYTNRRPEFVVSGVKDFTDDTTPIEAMKSIVHLVKKQGGSEDLSVIFNKFHEVT